MAPHFFLLNFSFLLLLFRRNNRRQHAAYTRALNHDFSLKVDGNAVIRDLEEESPDGRPRTLSGFGHGLLGTINSAQLPPRW
jgi:hypothetical protein